MNQTEWFLQKFREWETSIGRRQTEAAFAKFLGVKAPTLNRWMTGSASPEGENLRLLARKLDPEIYIILGKQIPADLGASDEDIAYIAGIMERIPLYKRAAFRKDIETIITKYIRENNESNQQ